MNENGKIALERHGGTRDLCPTENHGCYSLTSIQRNTHTIEIKKTRTQLVRCIILKAMLNRFCF